tara:strand:+ start:214 stop:579 length:366 start_codon:yes stop_codon:yes gene_type:complete
MPTEFYRVVGYFHQPGLHTERIIKYFATKKQAQSAIKEERSQSTDDFRIDLWLEKIVIDTDDNSLIKFLNEETERLLESVDHFPPSEISNGTNDVGRVNHIKVTRTIHFVKNPLKMENIIE